MTIVCTATGCTSRMGDLDKNDTKISFHRFPKNPELQEKWVRHMRRADWRPSNYSRLCSLHFEPACYQDGLARRVLHSYAVPTIFPIQSSVVNSEVVKKCPKKRRLLLKSSIEASTSSASQECQNESVRCAKKRRLVLNTSNEASTSSANPECQDENDVDPVPDAQETGGGEGTTAPAQLPLPESKVDNKQETEVQEEAKDALQIDKIEVPAEVVQGDEVEQTVVAPGPPPQNNQEPAKNISDATDTNGAQSIKGDWQQREAELLKKIDDLEKVKSERSEDALKLELKVREEEIDLLKARVKNLETELQAALSKPNGKNHEMIENIKQQHEELLSKARGMIFDKTKMVKNQELQIEALTTQVQSLKDINQITKDLLEIRNNEVKAMEDRFQAMDARYKAEKDRYGLVLQRAQTSSSINDDLKKEYETQLAIFKELREKYEQRVQALVAENNRLKESLKGGTSG